jgi:anti-sigma B factor antagonist
MDITQEEKNSIAVVTITGSLDALTAPLLTDYLNKEIGEGKSKLVVNLSGLEYTSSAGLRVLLNGVKESRQRGGDLRVAAVRPTVSRIFEISGFTSIMKFFADVDGAVKSFSA